MDALQSNETIDLIVRRIFKIDDITTGSKDFLYRYRGHLVGQDSAAAYDQLAAWLVPYNLTPLFRIEDNQQVILLVRTKPAPPPGRPVLNLVLFIITLLSVILSGWEFSNQPLTSTDPLQVVLQVLQAGWPFAVSLMAILGIHELGHYFAGRAHGVHVTLPYFIPLPFTGLGTLGAFISMQDVPRNRRDLMDIGVAGPLAGMVVSVVVMVIGLSLSKLDTLPLVIQQGQAFQIEGNSLLYLFLKYIRFGQLLPTPASYGGVDPLLYWIRYFFTAQPTPLGGTDVMIHPVAWAGWAGFLVTSLNLLPAGQLDGGHVFHLLFGTKTTKRFFPVLFLVLILLGFAWNGWWLWAFLILLVGRTYAEPLDQITPLDGKRKALGILALIVFILTFTPVPLTLLY
jgi:membrane-associated protease RseP (regulator of RpoE activity)